MTTERTQSRGLSKPWQEKLPSCLKMMALSEDRELEYLVSSWFPKGEVSLIGAPSGAGKTSFGLNLLESIRNGREVWGHPAKARDYRVSATIEASGASSAR